ncbi:MAG: hypothetical protein ACHREM_12460 [Polyangiales bacterium]
MSNLCSRPGCHVFTKGPRADGSRAKCIGRAAHIHAASPRGPRYLDTQSAAERAAYDNGIWLCANDAAEIDDDASRFTADKLREWKRDALALADRLIGTSAVTTGTAAPRGLIAIGPDVIVDGRIVRSARGSWTVAVDGFVLGDLSSLRRFGDAFAELDEEDCFVCVEAEGVGRMLVDGPVIEHVTALEVELRVAAPMPRSEAERRFDARQLGTDCALDLSGDEPDLDPIFPEISGIATIAQQLVMTLGTCKGGHVAGAESGSRVAELSARLGDARRASIIAVETIRLATVRHWDSFAHEHFVPLGFIERVRGVELLPTTSVTFAKAAIKLDVYGVEPGTVFIALISMTTRELESRPPLPSAPAP